MKRKSRDWDLTLELSCHAGCPTALAYYLVVKVVVFNTTFNNISVISWQSVLLMEEARVPGENTDLPQVLTN
jgi:hypothetical protein